MKNQTKRSLQFKLMTLSLGAMFAIGFTSWALLQSLWNRSETELLNQFTGTSQSISDALAAQFEERYEDVQSFALDSTLISAVQNSTKDKSAAVKLLNQWARLHPVIELFMVTDSNGNLVAVNEKSSTGKPIKSAALYGKSYKGETWFSAVMTEKFTQDDKKRFQGSYFENMQVDPWVSLAYGTKHLGSTFSAPIRNDAGETIGVLSTRLSNHWIDDVFSESLETLVQLGLKHADIQLLSNDGILLHERSEEMNAEQAFEAGRILKFNYRDTQTASAMKVSQGEFGSIFELDPLQNIEVMAGFYPLSQSKLPSSIGWNIRIAEDKAEGMGSLIRAKKLFYAVFGGIILLSIFIVARFSASLAKQLGGVAERLSAQSRTLASHSGELAASSAQLSSAAAEQAAAIQETAASIDEVSAMVTKSAENAALSQKSSAQSREAADRGKREMENMTSAIQDIYASNTAIMNQVDDGNKRISEIVKVIAEIGNKTKVINDIVFQTKLLSFNASVEAARAGEHGKGFAVVAEEVGNLAQMSGNAAKEISQMLDESIQKVDSIVSETQSKVGSLFVENKTKIELGTAISDRCGEALNQILNCVGQVDTMVSEISVSSQEQSQGVNEINKAINQMDSVTQQNASVAQSTSVTAKSIDQQSTAVRSLVEELTFLVHGSNTLPLPSAKPAEKSVTKKSDLAHAFSFKKKNVQAKAQTSEKVDLRHSEKASKPEVAHEKVEIKKSVSASANQDDLKKSKAIAKEKSVKNSVTKAPQSTEPAAKIIPMRKKAVSAPVVPTHQEAPRVAQAAAGTKGANGGGSSGPSFTSSLPSADDARFEDL